MPSPRALLRLVLTLAFASTAYTAAGAQERPIEARLERLEGGRLKLSELRGAPVLLELWATWCAPCVEQAEILHALAPELAARGVAVLAVDVGEARGVVEEYVADRPGGFPVVLDRGQAIPRQLDVGELPALALLRADGTTVGVTLGLTDRDGVLDLLDLLD